MSGQTRAVDILTLLVDSEGPRTLREVSESLSLSRTSAFRLLDELVREGWVTSKGRPRRYSPGIRVAGLGIRVPQYRHLRQRLLPYIMDLAEEVNYVTALAFYEAGLVVVTDGAEKAGGRLLIHIGGDELPAGCTSSGKILLAYQAKEEIERVCSTPLPKYTEQTRSPEELRGEVEQARAAGYGTSDRERFPDSSGVAFPVFDASGQPVAAIGISRIGRLDQAWIDEVYGPAQRLAGRASLELGYRPGQSPVLVS